MPYLITYTAPDGSFGSDPAQTPASALHKALDLKTRGFSHVRLSDVETGAESGIREFARAHDMSVVENHVGSPSGRSSQSLS